MLASGFYFTLQTTQRRRGRFRRGKGRDLRGMVGERRWGEETGGNVGMERGGGIKVTEEREMEGKKMESKWIQKKSTSQKTVMLFKFAVMNLLFRKTYLLIFK